MDNGTDRNTELGETLEDVVGDSDCVTSNGGLQVLLRLEGLEFMTETGNLNLEVCDRLESHSTF